MLLYHLLGGYICQDCIKYTDLCYKNYFLCIKKKKNQIKNEHEINKNIGVGAVVAFGIVGAFMAIKRNLF